MVDRHLPLLLLMCLSSYCMAQSCLPSGIDFTSQEQIDNFAADYGGCTTIEGNVKIFDNSGDITNLNGLSDLTTIEGSLDILLNSNLSNLDGLDNLSSVGDYLSISYSSQLTSLSGLENLNSVGGDLKIVQTGITNLLGLNNLTTVTDHLEIFNNGSLTSLEGIENLSTVGGDFDLKQSSLLTDISGLQNLTSIAGEFNVEYLGITDFSGLTNLLSIGGQLRIAYNDQLNNFNGLDNLSSLSGHLLLLQNQGLSGFSGLEKLTSIGGVLTVSGNDALTNLNGLNNLTSIGNYINIAYNDELVSLDGLNKLTQIGGNINIVNNTKLADISAIQELDPNTILSGNTFSSDIEIYGNTLLSVCDELPICLALENGKTADIHDNAVGCNTKTEIEFECASSILPVKWSAPLKVIHDKKGHLLTFATAQEINSDKFVIERSRDGINYTSISTLQGQGSANFESEYSFLDDSPYGGINYYRVQQIDFDAKYTYSNVVSIMNERSRLSMFPNPVKDLLTVLNTTEPTDIFIYNGQDQLVKKQSLHTGTNSLNLENLPTGFYMIKIPNRISKTIIKQ